MKDINTMDELVRNAQQSTQQSNPYFEALDIRMPVTDIEYDTISNMLSKASNPEEETYRIASALSFSRNTDIDFPTAYANLDALTEAQLGIKYTPNQTSFKAIQSSYKLGQLSMQRGNLGLQYKEAWQNGDEATMQSIDQQIQAIDAQMLEMQYGMPKGATNYIFQVAAQNASYMSSVFVKGAEYGMVGTMLGTAVAKATVASSGAKAAMAAVGGSIGFPAMAGVAAVAILASAYGRFKEASKVTEGNEFYDMIHSEGIKPEIAESLSTLSGNLSGAIEAILGDTITAGLSAMGIPVDSIASQLTTRLYASGKLGRLGLFATQMGVSTVSEGAEEAVDSFAGDAVTALGRLLSDLDPNFSLSESGKKAAKEFMAGAAANLLYGPLPTALNIRTDVKNLQAIRNLAVVTPSKEVFMQMTENVAPEGMNRKDWYNVRDNIYEKAEDVRNVFGMREYVETAEMDLPDIDEVAETDEEVEQEATKPRSGNVERKKDGSLNLQRSERTTRLPGDEGYRHIMKIGSANSSERYGHIEYDVKGNDLTIRNVRFYDEYNDLREEAVRDFLLRNRDYDIHWDTDNDIDEEVKQNLIDNNPNGPEAGLQYGSTDFNVDDNLAVQKKLNLKQFSKDPTEIKAMATLVQMQASTMGLTGEEFIDKYLGGEIRNFTSAKLDAARLDAGRSLDPTEEELDAITKGELEEITEDTIVPGGLREQLEGIDLDMQKRAMTIWKGTRAIVYAGKYGNPTSFEHEMVHVIMRLGEHEDQFQKVYDKVRNTDQFKNYVDANHDIIHATSADLENMFNGEWGADEQEFVADLFESYRRNEQSVDTGLRHFFNEVANWFRQIYNTLKNAGTLNDEVREYFDALYGTAEDLRAKRGAEGVGVNRSSDEILAQEMSKLDQEYFKAIEEGDAEKLEQMVREAAEKNGLGDAIPEHGDGYTIRTKPAPKKTIKVYKVFTVDGHGRPTALFVNSGIPLPMGVWLDAVDTFHFAVSEKNEDTGKIETRWYVPSTKNPNTGGGATGTSIDLKDKPELKKKLVEMGYISESRNSITGLAYRPGWHAGDLPFFPQGGKRDTVYYAQQVEYKKTWKAVADKLYEDSAYDSVTKAGKPTVKHNITRDASEEMAKKQLGTFDEWREQKYPGSLKAHPYLNIHRFNQVVFECEMSIDTNYSNGHTSASGGWQWDDMQEMPLDGSYKFATNPMAKATDIGAWYISSTLKIVRALSEDEANQILTENNFEPQAWQKYYKPTLKKNGEYKIENGTDERGPMDLARLNVSEEEMSDAYRKTLAPITYDENGEIIPLSKRFDTSKPNDILYQSIGKEGAENLDLTSEVEESFIQKYDMALDMERHGISAADIKRETGWERGIDKEWRMDLPDRKDRMNFRKVAANPFKSFELKDVYLNKELYEAYPQLADINIIFYYPTDGEDGFYSADRNAIYINRAYLDLVRQKRSSDDFEALIAEEALQKVLVHEIQHAIQKIENFARGGNPETVKDYVHRSRMKLDPEGIKLSDDYKNAVKLAFSFGWLKSYLEGDTDYITPEMVQKIEDYFLEVPSEFTHEIAPNINTTEDLFNLSAGEAEALTKAAFDKQLNLSNERDAHVNQLTGKAALYYQLDQNYSDDLYHRLAGEIEARATEAKLGSSKDFRQILTETVEDVKRSEALVLKDYKNLANDILFQNAEEKEIIKQAKADRTYLKAPNGRESNLTPKQWLQVRTKAFKKWFGNSIAVDENGEPQVFYHGSPTHNIEVFELGHFHTGMDRGGFSFTNRKDVAESYAGKVSSIEDVMLDWSRAILKTLEDAGLWNSDEAAFTEEFAEMISDLGIADENNAPDFYDTEWWYDVFPSFLDDWSYKVADHIEAKYPEAANKLREIGDSVDKDWEKYFEPITDEDIQNLRENGELWQYDSGDDQVFTPDDPIFHHFTENLSEDEPFGQFRTPRISSEGEVYPVFLKVPEGSKVMQISSRNPNEGLPSHYDEKTGEFYSYDVRKEPTHARIIEMPNNEKVVYIADPNMIKSAISNNGDFSSNNDSILFQSNDGNTQVRDFDDSLVITHNLYSDSVEKIAELGGMPMPSLAIVKPSAQQDMSFFGNIVLVGDEDLAKRVANQGDTWAGDIYSPKVPGPITRFNQEESLAKFKSIDNDFPEENIGYLGNLNFHYMNKFMNMEQSPIIDLFEKETGKSQIEENADDFSKWFYDFIYSNRVSEKFLRKSDGTEVPYTLANVFDEMMSEPISRENIPSFASFDEMRKNAENLPKEVTDELFNDMQFFFEAKPREVLQLSDFTAAFIPQDITEKAKQILTDAGLDLVPYPASWLDDIYPYLKDYAERQPKILFQSADQDTIVAEVGGEMLITRSMRSDKIAKIKTIGGMPMPSLAISNKAHFNAALRYGPVTLIGNEKLAQRVVANQDTYSRDIWSPLEPSPVKKVDLDELRNIYKKHGFDMDNYEAIKDWHPLDLQPGRIFSYISSTESGFYMEELKKEIESITGNFTYKVEKGKMPQLVPYTAENITEFMKRDGIKGGNNDLDPDRYDVMMRVASATRFKDWKHFKDNEYLLSRTTLDEREKEARVYDDFYKSNIVDAVEESIINYFLENEYDTEESVNNYLDSLSITDEDDRQLVKDYIEINRKEHTSYFEAKPQEVLQFSDFSAAMIPSDLPESDKAILREAGLELVEYSMEDRIQKTQEYVESHPSLLFQDRSYLDELEEYLPHATDFDDLLGYMMAMTNFGEWAKDEDIEDLKEYYYLNKDDTKTRRLEDPQISIPDVATKLPSEDISSIFETVEKAQDTYDDYHDPKRNTLMDPDTTIAATEKAKNSQFVSIIKNNVQDFLDLLVKQEAAYIELDKMFEGQLMTEDDIEAMEQYRFRKERAYDDVSPFIQNVMHSKKNLTDTSAKKVVSTVRKEVSAYRNIVADITGQEYWRSTEELAPEIAEVIDSNYDNMTVAEKRRAYQEALATVMDKKIKEGNNDDLKVYREQNLKAIKDLEAEIAELEERLKEEKKAYMGLELDRQDIFRKKESLDKEVTEAEKHIGKLDESIQAKAKKSGADVNLDDVKKAQTLKQKISALKLEQQKVDTQIKNNAVKDAKFREAWKAQKKLNDLRNRMEEKIAKLKEKQRLERELRKEDSYRQALIHSIMKPVAKSIAIDEAEQIMAIQAGIDPHNRKSMTFSHGPKVDINYLKKLFANVPDDPIFALLKPEQLERLSQLSLDEMTTDMLEDLQVTVDALRQLGRRKRQAYIDMQQRSVNHLRKLLTRQLMDSGKYIHDPIKGTKEEQKRKSRWIQKAKDIYGATINMARKAQMLDGDTKGLFYNLLIRKKRELQDLVAVNVTKRVDPILDMMKELGVENEDLYQNFNVEIDGESRTYDLSSLMYVYFSQFNEKNIAAVAFGELVGEAEKSRIDEEAWKMYPEKHNAKQREARADYRDKQISELGLPRYQELLGQAKEIVQSDERVFQIAKAIEKDFNSESFARVVELMRRMYNIDVKREDYYLPINREEFNGEEPGIRLKNDILGIIPGTRGSVEKGFTKERIEMNAYHQKRVDMDFFGLWQNSVFAQEHALANMEYVKELNSVFLGPNSSMLRDAIVNIYGENMFRDIETHIKEISNPKAFERRGAEDAAIRILRGNLYSAYLGYKVSGVVLQGITSPAPFLGKVNPIELMKGYIAVMLHPIESIDTINHLSPFMRDRSFDIIGKQIKDELHNMDVDSFGDKVKKKMLQFQNVGMMGLELIDRYAVAGGWLAIYNKNLAAGMDPVEAIRDADEYVRETQPLSDITELAPMFKNRNQAMQTITAFQSSMNVIWNNCSYDVRVDALKRHNFRQALGTIVGYMLAGALLELVREGFKDDDDEPLEGWDLMRRLVYSFTTQPVSGIPLVADFADAIAERVITGEKPHMYHSDLYPTVSSVYKAIDKAIDGDADKALQYIMDAVALATGMPKSGFNELKQVLKIGPEALLGRRDYR